MKRYLTTNFDYIFFKNILFKVNYKPSNYIRMEWSKIDVLFSMRKWSKNLCVILRKYRNFNGVSISAFQFSKQY